MRAACFGLFVSLLVPAWAAHAEDAAPARVAVGDPSVHGDSLQPYENAWRMQITPKDGGAPREAGTWRDRFEVVDVGGRWYGVRSQAASFINQQGQVAATTQTVNVFDRATMAPVSRHYERHVAGKSDSSVQIDFRPDAMDLESVADGKASKQHFAVAPAYDFDGGLYALLWATMPLKPGYAASLPSYSEDEHPEAVAWRTFRVTGSARVSAGHLGEVDCLIVEGDSGSGPLKYWISAKAPYIIQLEFAQGATGARWLLTMT